MKIFSIHTLGCKVNQYESQQIRQFLEGFGFRQLILSDGHPDLVIVNTCCLTRSASAQSRRCVRRAQKQHPSAAIVICGCLPLIQSDELKVSGKELHIVRKRDELPLILSRITDNDYVTADFPISDIAGSASENSLHKPIKPKNSSEIKPKNKLFAKLQFNGLTSFKGRTRAFLKVQDGCDGYCTYCIIPKTRPKISSKPVEKVLAEAEALVMAGNKEIVVTGISVGAYGEKTVQRLNRSNPQNDKLAVLLERLAKLPQLERIRLSSIEPLDVTEHLLDVFSKNRNIMPQLHLSLQSGSDAVLKRMARQYNTKQFTEMVQLIKSRLDRPAITTDLIVGFPGETDADFRKTVELAENVGFANMHVFSFSPRKATTAAKMQPLIKEDVIKQRAHLLRRLDTELQYKFRQQFAGEKASVLIENVNNGMCSGRCERYFMVQFDAPAENHKKNDIVSVQLTMENMMAGKTAEAGNLRLTGTETLDI